MNDPFVIEQAKGWARGLLADSTLVNPAAKVVRMFEQALGRPPTQMELEASLAFLRDLRREQDSRSTALNEDEGVWSQLGHAILELKEFIYLR